MSDKFAVLGILRHRNLHGYDISRRLKDIEGFWYISPGNLYRALKSLERDGLIGTRKQEEHLGRIRIIYGITESGKKAFDEWVSSPAMPPRTRHEAYLKIWLAGEDRQRIRTQLEQIRAESRKILDMFSQMDGIQVPGYLGWMLEAGKAHVELDLKWSENCLGRLDEEEDSAAGSRSEGK